MKKIERFDTTSRVMLAILTLGDSVVKRKDLDALEAELEKQQWISVKDELPKTEGKKRIKYLCWNHDGQFVTEWREYTTGTGFDESFGSVLFWKPLSDPPEDEG